MSLDRTKLHDLITRRQYLETYFPNDPEIVDLEQAIEEGIKLLPAVRLQPPEASTQPAEKPEEKPEEHTQPYSPHPWE